MEDNTRPEKNNRPWQTISARFMLLVFSIYLFAAFMATFARIWIDYVDTRNSVIQSLVITQKAYERGISRAIWFIDRDYLEAEFKGIMENPHVVGLKITGDQNFSFGKTTAEEPGATGGHDIGTPQGDKPVLAGNTTLLAHEFYLVHTAEDGETYRLGKAVLYTSKGVVFEKLRNKILLTLVNFILLTIILGLIIYLIGRRILSKPLGQLTTAIEMFDPDRPKQVFDLSRYKGKGELAVLARAFSAMQSRLTNTVASLRKSRSELMRLNENLETIVEDRTAELTLANKLLKEEIQERERAEQESSRLEERLRQAHKMEAVGTLAGGIAHDFNNILGIIIGNTELAVEDLPEWNPARAYLDEIKIAGLRARDVVRQLLSFSRKTEQQRKPIQIGSIVEESIGLLRSSIPTTIEIRANIPENLGMIKADPTQIHQVLINLCTNASHAMEGTDGVLALDLSEVTLNEAAPFKYRTLMPGKYLRLTVSDTGSGIDPHIQEKIFDPYFTTKAVGKGTGMGLAVVHGIVNSHDGAISMQSRPGRGTEVRVLFPVTEEAAVKEGEISDAVPEGNERILLVDDEESLVKLGRGILERLCYRVETRTDPKEALELFRSAPDDFDLIITDMTMPGMAGDQLALKIQEIRPDFPIILCTGFSSRIDEKRAYEMGIRKYIEKPFNSRVLGRAIREALEK